MRPRVSVASPCSSLHRRRSRFGCDTLRDAGPQNGPRKARKQHCLILDMLIQSRSLHVYITMLFVCFLGHSIGVDAKHGPLHRKPPQSYKAHALRLDIDAPTLIERRHASSSSNPPERTREQASHTQFALPRPFDSSLGNNFTSESCPAFFHDFLGDQNFQRCLPLSLLLQVSPPLMDVPSRILIQHCRRPQTPSFRSFPPPLTSQRL